MRCQQKESRYQHGACGTGVEPRINSTTYREGALLFDKIYQAETLLDRRVPPLPTRPRDYAALCGSNRPCLAAQAEKSATKIGCLEEDQCFLHTCDMLWWSVPEKLATVFVERSSTSFTFSWGEFTLRLTRVGCELGGVGYDQIPKVKKAELRPVKHFVEEGAYYIFVTYAALSSKFSTAAY